MVALPGMGKGQGSAPACGFGGEKAALAELLCPLRPHAAGAGHGLGRESFESLPEMRVVAVHVDQNDTLVCSETGVAVEALLRIVDGRSCWVDARVAHSDSYKPKSGTTEDVEGFGVDPGLEALPGRDHAVIRSCE